MKGAYTTLLMLCVLAQWHSGLMSAKPLPGKPKPLKLSRVLVIHIEEGKPATLTLDGKPQKFENFSIRADITWPFDLIMIDGEYSFSTEVWAGENIVHIMPPDTEWARSAVNLFLEGSTAVANFDIPTEPDAWRAKVDALRTERANHEGAINHIAWDRIRRMLAVHELNFQQLRLVFEDNLKDEVFLMELVGMNADPLVRETRLTSLEQGVYNFVATGYALEQQSNTIIGAYSGSEFASRFLAKRNELSSTGEVAFARGLRSFLTHQKLPYPQLRWSMSNEGASTSSSIAFSHDELELYDGWDKAAKEYMRGFDQEVPLFEALVKAFEAEKTFWVWALRQTFALNRLQRTLADEVAIESNWVMSNGHNERPRRTWAHFAAE